MRIAVSADNNDGLDSIVSPHFGRCPFFAIVDIQDGQVQATNVLKNPLYGHHQPGQVPAFIHSQGANIMLTGGMGMRAIQFFQQYGIEAATGASGTVRMALERYLGGEIQGAAPCQVSQEHKLDDGAYEQDDIGRLREEVEMLGAQLDEATDKLDRMSK